MKLHTVSSCFVCKDCGVLVSLLRQEEKDAQDKCVRIYCNTGYAYVHLCYLQPLKLDPPSKGLPKHIYFNYETWVKAEERHCPNMAIAQYADGKEFRLPRDGQLMRKSDAVAREFGEWLFAEHHKEHTIIAHNFPSYDGHFTLKHLLDN